MSRSQAPRSLTKLIHATITRAMIILREQCKQTITSAASIDHLARVNSTPFTRMWTANRSKTPLFWGVSKRPQNQGVSYLFSGRLAKRWEKR